MYLRDMKEEKNELPITVHSPNAARQLVLGHVKGRRQKLNPSSPIWFQGDHLSEPAPAASKGGHHQEGRAQKRSQTQTH